MKIENLKQTEKERRDWKEWCKKEQRACSQAEKELGGKPDPWMNNTKNKIYWERVKELSGTRPIPNPDPAILTLYYIWKTRQERSFQLQDYI